MSPIVVALAAVAINVVVFVVDESNQATFGIFSMVEKQSLEMLNLHRRRSLLVAFPFVFS